MRITESARGHGVMDHDIHHAVRYYLRIYEDQGDVAMLIGPAADGSILEIGVVLDDEDPRIIHAMRARRKYWPGGKNPR
jgi:predicted transcriptional regulator